MNSEQERHPPCRCEFVQRWLDAHEKYFTKTKPTKDSYTHVAHRTYGHSQLHYGFSEGLQFSNNVVQLPYVVQPPYRFSPMQPPH